MLCRGQWDGQWVFAKRSKRTKGSTPPVTVAVPPILPPATLAALRSYLDSTKLVRGRKGVHPLSGRLYCPCGVDMTGVARSDRSNRRYRCRNGRNEPGRPFCTYPSVLADKVDDAVWTEVLTDENYLRELAREHLGPAADATKASADMMREAIAAVGRTRRGLAAATARAYSDGLDEETRVMVTSSLIEQYRAALTHQAMVAQVFAETDEQSQRLGRLDRVARMASGSLVDADKELRAQVLGLLVVKVQIIDHGTDGRPMRLRMAGVLDDVRLSDAESADWHLTVGATGR